MIKACIFDLDGTLLDTLDALSYCTNAVTRGYGLGEIPRDEFKWMVGDGYYNQIRRSLTFLKDPDFDLHYEETCKNYIEFFSEHSLHGVAPYDGIIDMLGELRKRDLKVACFSNKPDAQAIENIRVFFGPQYFDETAGQIDGVPKKPDPSGALRLADIFGCKPEECLYIGDTNTDMKTGIAAGMVTIGVLWGFREYEELAAFHPYKIISHPSEIPGIIDEINGRE
ncbi:MAG: HAD family hydrolase [Lachnospiraceae bacterium]|nr:HAD family hydrolase [Lachnospiraceae bacterium]